MTPMLVFRISLLAYFCAAAHSAAAQAAKVVTPAGRTGAQAVAAAGAGRPVTNVEIADALRRSGLTHEAARERLRSAGYDPSLADPYYAVPSSAGNASLADAGVVSTMARETQIFQALGILAPTGEGVSDFDPDAPARASMVAPPSAAPRSVATTTSSVFGKNVFHNAATAFAAVATGPVDPSYRLGVGDELQLVLTGDTEQAHHLNVRRDGTVLIPELGQVSLAGLTLDAARATIRNRAAVSYSGLKAGTTRLDLSLGRIRNNAVFVIGEVEHPGALVVSALSTAFHAITRAGGPSERGSFRNIELRRGGEILTRLDLYKYLLDGDASSDLRTEQGDVLYVPLASRSVRVAGAVRRAGIFELQASEGFDALLRFAGGVQATAALDRIQIDRVLPPEQRAPGVERTLIDVPVSGSLDALRLVPLFDGDVVTVFSIGDLRRNTITVDGAVVSPGTFEVVPGMTLHGQIERAQGLLPTALRERVRIVRPVPRSGLTEEFLVDLTSSAGREFPVQEFDRIVVHDGRRPAGTVSVEGAVWRPGSFERVVGQTLASAVDEAGGLKPEAFEIIVSRKRVGQQYSDTTTHAIRIPLGDVDEWLDRALAFPLHTDDHVYVLAAAGVRDQRFVSVQGLFAHPGTYAINEGIDRVADLVRRAGSPLPNAYLRNSHVRRSSLPVAFDLSLAIGGDARHNLLLMHGDAIFVGPNPNTVLVSGEVAQTVLVAYRPGLSLRDYVELAGGPNITADLSRATVEDLSGTVGRSKRTLLLFRSSPPVRPGAKITVPARPESKAVVRETLNTVLQYATAIASLAVTYVVVQRR